MTSQQSQQPSQQRGQRPPARAVPYSIHQARTRFRPPPFNGQRSNSQFGMSLPPPEKKKVSEAEAELKESSTKLLAATLGQFASSADHKTRFSKELNDSKTVSNLLEGQLTFVGDLHPLVQMGMLIGEKFWRTKFS